MDALPGFESAGNLTTTDSTNLQAPLVYSIRSPWDPETMDRMVIMETALALAIRILNSLPKEPQDTETLQLKTATGAPAQRPGSSAGNAAIAL